ncbi:MAG TPA: tetratricopeptide repeat protein [Candidatus Paceibacterota bacterium]
MIKNLKFEFWIFTLVFILLGLFLIHSFDSIGQDIGRHLKVGEIIWQIKEVPKTNLFSFTESDFPFINHHWLSEVIFFEIFSYFGFTGLIFLKTILVLTTFLLLFFSIKNYVNFWPLLVSFLFSIFIFISRTEVRPEIFSFIILSFFLFALFRAKHEKLYFYLWFLPIFELFWVNLHIYFFIGPFLVTAFLIDKLVNRNLKRGDMSLLQFGGEESDAKKRHISSLTCGSLKTIIIVLFLTVVATLINPAGMHGVLLPLNILREYGYSIVENQTLAFLADFFGFNLSIFVFKVSAVVLVASFILTAKKARQRIFEIIVSIFFVYAGFRMLRNLPLYALASFPVMAILLTDVFNKLTVLTTLNIQRTFNVKKSSDKVFKVAVAVFLIFMIFFVMSGGYYKKAGLSKAFGLSVPNGLERAVNFVKENKIEGPMFNNFDIGGYLIWKLPEHKVFVDNRPEAYSTEFFNEIYKPMQESKEKWAEFSEKYGINFVFFAHSDATPWGQTFIINVIKDSDWQVVYVNEEVIILLKNKEKNSGVISRYSISQDNAIDRTIINIKSSNENNANLNTTLSRFFYNIGWREVSIYFADGAIKENPQNPYPYLYKGLVYAYYTDVKIQKLAGENIKKAIDLGLKESQYYYILGVVYMNLGRLESAQTLFKEAVRLDKNNTQAKEFLEKYF